MDEQEKRRRLFQVTTTYYCAGIVTNDDLIVVEAAPILRWSIGRHIDRIASSKAVVGCMELTENGKFRHPRFVRLREDI